MRRTAGILFFIIALSSVLIAPTLFADDKRIAVLEFQNKANMKQDDISYLAELFRGIAVPLRSKGYIIMTKENMISLLPPSKKLEQCVGECEVETGRNLGAHYIVAGAVYKIDEGYRLMVKLYETKGGSLIGTSSYSGQGVGELEKKVKEDTANNIFKSLRLQGSIVSDRTFGKDSQETWDPGLEEATVVEFSSTPQNAQVIIDNIPKCNTPCSAELTIGRHSLVMTIARYLPLQDDIAVKKGMAKIDRKLEENFGHVNVTSKPEGLDIHLDQKPIGKSPLKADVDPGKHTVTIKSDQYYEKGMEFTLKRGEEKSIVLEPVAKIGALDIRAFDDRGSALKAEVVIDGKSAGETPLVLKNFLIGQHSIVIKKDGFGENKQDVKIEEKKVTKHEVKLAKGSQSESVPASDMPTQVSNCPAGFVRTGGSGKTKAFCIETKQRPETTYIEAWTICERLSFTKGRASLCDEADWKAACNADKSLGMTGHWEWVAEFNPYRDVFVAGYPGCSDLTNVFPGNFTFVFRCCVR